MSVERLITDRDVLAAPSAEPLIVGPGTLITPAARDRAAARGLIVLEGEAAEAMGRGSAAEGRACGGAGGEPCGCACHRRKDRRGDCQQQGSLSALDSPDDLGSTTLVDGLHLVRVVGGRILSAHTAATTPAQTPPD